MQHEERAMFETIAEVQEIAIARVLITALRAHGFSPLDNADGIPGLPGAIGPRGIPISVPEEEAGDARVLAEDLLREMMQ
jgi:hypothetical protein